MDHVQQLGPTDCGVAVAAMLAGCSYRQAFYGIGLPSLDAGVHPAVLVEGLAWLGAPAGIYRHAEPLTLRDWVEAYGQRYRRRRVALLIACGPSDDAGHWVAFEGRQVHDPERPQPCTVERYHWSSAHVRYWLV